MAALAKREKSAHRPEEKPWPRPAKAKSRPEEEAPLPMAGLVKSSEYDPNEVSGPVASLLESLRSGKARERERSTLALAGMGSKAAAALPGLRPVLTDDPSPRVRACAALALASITRGRDDAVYDLSRALSDPHPGVRTSAAQSLGRIGTPQAEQAFLHVAQERLLRLRGLNPWAGSGPRRRSRRSCATCRPRPRLSSGRARPEKPSPQGLELPAGIQARQLVLG